MKPRSKLPSDWQAAMFSDDFTDDDDELSFDNVASDFADSEDNFDLEVQDRAFSQSHNASENVGIKTDESARESEKNQCATAAPHRPGYVTENGVNGINGGAGKFPNRTDVLSESYNRYSSNVQVIRLTGSKSVNFDTSKESGVMFEEVGVRKQQKLQCSLEGPEHHSVINPTVRQDKIHENSHLQPSSTLPRLNTNKSATHSSPSDRSRQPRDLISRRHTSHSIVPCSQSNKPISRRHTEQDIFQTRKNVQDPSLHKHSGLSCVREGEVVYRHPCPLLDPYTPRQLNVGGLGDREDEEEEIVYLHDLLETRQEEETAKKDPKTAGLWSVLRRKVLRRSSTPTLSKSRTIVRDKETGLESKLTKDKAKPGPFTISGRPFSRRKHASISESLETVTDRVPFYQDNASSSTAVDSSDSGVGKPSSSSIPVAPISLQRRAMTYTGTEQPPLSQSPDTKTSRSPSPLVQLSLGDFYGCEEDEESDTSSVASLSTSFCSSQSDSGDSSCGSGQGSLKSPRSAKHDLEEGLGGKTGREEGGSGGGVGGGGARSSPRVVPRLVSRHGRSRSNTCNCPQPCKVVSSRYHNDITPKEFEGPHGRLFTAKLFNRIGQKRTLCNVSHVSHVYKGTVLVTDLLGGKILHTARSGRTMKWFETEPGSEPWCACITPRGHVAVTLRHPPCVTVWSGHGTLVREFGHDVLQCPTGLTCDHQGRFIVTDERTNLVAFFGPDGEFLQFLAHSPPAQTAQRVQSGDGPQEKTESLSICQVSNGNESDITKEHVITKTKQAHRSVRFADDPNDNCIMEDKNTPTSTQADDTDNVTPDTRTEPYVFNLPRYVCVSSSGNVLVSDSGSHSIKVFSPEGGYLHSIGSYGSHDGQLKVPYGVCCDQKDNVYVADHYNDRVSVFSMQGDFLQHVLTSTTGLSRPKSVAIRPAHVRKLFVAHGGLRSTEVLVYRLESEPQTVSFKIDL